VGRGKRGKREENCSREEGWGERNGDRGNGEGDVRGEMIGGEEKADQNSADLPSSKAVKGW